MKEGNEDIEASCGEGGCSAAYAYIIMVMSYMVLLLFLKVFTEHSHTHCEEKEQGEELLRKETGGLDGTKSNILKTQSPAIAAGLMTFISLSFHSIFLGLALGLDSTLPGIINIAIGILSHKWADTLALTFALRRSKSSYIRPLYLVPLQSLVCPLGIIIGMFISEAENDFVEGFFLSVSAGCFVYFFTSDIVSEVFRGGNKGWKYGVALLGIGVFTVALTLGEYYGAG